MVSAKQALERLRGGNREFVARTQRGESARGDSGRIELPGDQSPFAVILGCLDSRVPPEIIFNQGLGDLFVIRVAGNIVAPSQAGSVEFAAAYYQTPLVVVLGHTRCGAILATLEEVQNPTENQSPNLRSILDRVRPSVEGLLDTELRNDMPALVQRAVRANVAKSVDHLRSGSDLLERLINEQKLAVVGAEYSLETGEVEFFDVRGAE